MPKVVNNTVSTEKNKAPVEPVKFDDEKGEAVLTLESGIRITISEPPPKRLIYFGSMISAAPDWQKTDIMSVFMLVYFMITGIADSNGNAVDKPDTLDGFMDLLEDDRDIGGVAKVLAKFPNTVKRLSALNADSSRSDI